MKDWTPDMCRAKRWDAEPAFDGDHDPHLFRYGPHGIYVGSCAGRRAQDDG